MGNYMGQKPSFTLFDDEAFTTKWSNTPLRERSQAESNNPMASSMEEPFISPQTAMAGVKGAQAGGLSGALMSGGISSLLTSGAAAGGPYAIAGGLLLSELEAAQRAKAEQEAQEIANEKNRRANMQNVLQQNARTTFKV